MAAADDHSSSTIDRKDDSEAFVVKCLYFGP